MDFPPKRPREGTDDDCDDASPRKRSHSHSPRNGSPAYRLAERPARRYSRDRSVDDSADERRYYDRRTRSRSRLRSPSRSRLRSPSTSRLRSPSTSRLRSPSRSPSRSRSRSPSPSRSQSNTPPPRKPTALNYTPRLILRGHKRAISCLEFSPDGLWIASGSADATIKIWSSSTGALEHTLEGHLAGINALTWSPDSTTLASGSDDKSIRLWDAHTGLAHPTPLIGHHNYVYSLAFSPKGNMLVSGSYDEAVFLWDVRAARVMRSLPAHSDPVSAVDFVCDGTLIVSCSHDGLIRVWDTSTGQCLRTLVHEDNAPVTSVRFSPNGKYILAHTLDSSIRLWDYATGKGKCVKTYQGHTNADYSLSGAFGTYGHRTDPKETYAFVASGSDDGGIVLWDVSSKIVLQRLSGHDEAVLAVDTHPKEEMIASAGLDRTIRIWKAAPLSEVRAKQERSDGYDPDTLPSNPFAAGSPAFGTPVVGTPMNSSPVRQEE